MTRFAYAAAQSASTEETVQFRLFADVTFTTTMIRACTGVTPIVWGVNTYSAIGAFGGLDKVQEDAEPFPRAVRLWMSAVGSAQMTEPLTEQLFNKPVKLYRGFLDTAKGTLVSTPELMFSGFINTCEIKLRDPTRGNYFELEIESRLARQPRAAWFNKETLWQTYSGDTFFNFIDQIPNFKALWGNQATFFNAGANAPMPAGTYRLPTGWHI